MIALVLFVFFQGNILVEGGISTGTGFATTTIHSIPSVSIHSFPFSIKNIGIFNTLEWRNYRSNHDPFEVNIKDKTFVIGSTFRIIKPKIQPSFRIGLMHFIENTEITFYDKPFIDEETRKNALFFGTGAYVKVWKKIYLDSEISFAVSRRPPWRIAARAGWFF